MLLAASCSYQIDIAKQCGFESLVSDERYYTRVPSGIEDGPLDISRVTLLLSYYSLYSEITTNSKWLRIAITHAKSQKVHRYSCPLIQTKRDRSELKRVWCRIRDRIISLGVNRPIQIAAEFGLNNLGLTIDNLAVEIFHSEVYRTETKSALCRVLSRLVPFCSTVTKLLTIVYPTTQALSWSVQDHGVELARLEEAKSSLLQWELDWMMPMDGKCPYLHSSLVLYTNLTALYYYSARTALCNYKCLKIGETRSPKEHGEEQLVTCRTELMKATGSTAQKIKPILTSGVADKLPISAVVYTVMLHILLSAKAQLSISPEDKQYYEVILLFFMEIYRHYSFRYYTKRTLAVTSAALQLCQHPSIRLQVRTQIDEGTALPTCLSFI
ncbi:uncharacterized protein ATNIH1004_004673 [Aspergillus tanneri]|uniref:Transcription factor domain-containing protein n=1 Tax=Aspergillus tanneri TaxID=1220188 RepID=A0A5M9MPF0_9EURO|nr:uncharacterized protein ATNIH1004_004673 [Aspergillus tanneri]KAA8648788.1 hypothetical protein ATNIH1004_004673 [Aspergillus tanneri]